MKVQLAAFTTAALLLGHSAYGVQVLFEDFESPDVEAAASNGDMAGGVVPDNGKWVGATQGFGANRRGIADESSGHFTEVGAGEQAFAFRYTNSGLTSAAGVIGALTLGNTYTVSFDVVRDLGRFDGLPYNFALMAWNPDDPVNGPIRRDDVRSNNFGTVLASASGNASEDDLYTTITVVFTPTEEDHSALLGRDVTLRFRGATTSATIDNVIVDVDGGAVALPGDTNGDNDVDDSDLGTSFANYTGPVGDVGKTAAEGDTDGDGDVDDSDLGTSFANYTGPLSPTAVPEPTSLALLGLGGLAMIRRRR